MPEDTLNIDYHIKRLFLKALNKYRSKIEIYQALGISRTRYNNLYKEFDVKKVNGKFIIESDPPIMEKPTKHKWKDNACVHCGLQRRERALTQNLLNYYGRYFYDYFANGAWSQQRPDCKSKDYKTETL